MKNVKSKTKSKTTYVVVRFYIKRGYREAFIEAERNTKKAAECIKEQLGKSYYGVFTKRQFERMTCLSRNERKFDRFYKDEENAYSRATCKE